MSNFFVSQKPLLKNAYATFLQAKTFTKLLMLFLLCKNKYFYGKAFFKPFRKAIVDSALEREDSKEEVMGYLEGLA